MTPAPAIPGATLVPTCFTALPRWSAVGLAEAWATVAGTAAAIVAGTAALRPAVPSDPSLMAAFRVLAATPRPDADADARALFERHFVPFDIVRPNRAPGFLTGYYEPVLAGSRQRSERFGAPILPRPDDLVTFAPGETHPGVPETHSAGRQSPGGPTIYPDRAAIECLATGGAAAPVVWLRDWTEVFLVHVQGSARVELEDGSVLRLVYAGRNGHPYTSIGRILIETGAIPEGEMTLDVLKAWLRRHGQDEGQEGRRLMQRNRSYIFFREVSGDVEGPIGGAGVALQPRRSIAIDRTVWSYGLPFWIASDGAVAGFGPDPLARLFVAQDTGSAIVGPARVDLFLGSGETAGRDAGLVRTAAAVTVLLPRAS